MYPPSRVQRTVTPFARQLRAVAHVHRLGIVYLLVHDPLRVRDIVQTLHIPQNLVAHHLHILYQEGWVSKMKQGRMVTYTLNKKAFLEMWKLLKSTPFGRDFQNS